MGYKRQVKYKMKPNTIIINGSRVKIIKVIYAYEDLRPNRAGQSAPWHFRRYEDRSNLQH